MKTIRTIILILAIIIATIFITRKFFPDRYETVSIDTVALPPIIKIDTVDRIITKWYAKLDTVILIDSIEQIIASADTTIQNDSTYLAVKYFYPPLNYFNIDLRTQKKTIYQDRYITKEVVKEEGFFDKFGYGLQAGFGYDVANKQECIYIGLGIFYKFN